MLTRRVRWRALCLGEFVTRMIKIVGLVAVAAMLPACATVTRGTSQKYSIETTPTAANVALSTGQTCVSPCNLKLKRKDGFTVTASKEGYENATAKVESKIKGGGVAGAAGNIILGGIIGAAVDGSNGSMRDLTPNPLHLTLNPIAPVVTTSAAEPVEAPKSADAPAPSGN